jgi:ADP-ribose pyrophosphatase YjhB (NUDIX family)
MKQIIIRVRGIIINDNKLLLVGIAGNDYFCLPGGKLEYGEDVKECLERELIEELGVKPDIGNLLYINTFIDRKGNHNLDFIFEVLNGANYVNLDGIERTHAFELDNIHWASRDEDTNFLPKTIINDFKNDSISSNEVKYIKD